MTRDWTDLCEHDLWSDETWTNTGDLDSGSDVGSVFDFNWTCCLTRTCFLWLEAALRTFYYFPLILWKHLMSHVVSIQETSGCRDVSLCLQNLRPGREEKSSVSTWRLKTNLHLTHTFLTLLMETCILSPVLHYHWMFTCEPQLFLPAQEPSLVKTCLCLLPQS